MKKRRLYALGLAFVLVVTPAGKLVVENMSGEDLEVKKPTYITVNVQRPPVDDMVVVAAEIEPEPEPIYHLVVPGDTLGGLAVTYDTTVADLKLINGLDSDTIYVDQKLLVGNAIVTEDAVLEIPESSEPFLEEVVEYTVQQGDALYNLAMKYGVSENSIRETNGISGNMIRVGQILEIVIPNNNIDHLSDSEINARIEMADLPEEVFPDIEGLDMPHYWEDELNNTEWLEIAYKFNIEPEFLMAIALLETHHFTNDTYTRQNNVGGIRYNGNPEVEALGNNNGFETYKTMKDSIASLGYLIRMVYLNAEITNIEEFHAKYAPTEGEINAAEEAVNQYWKSNVAEFYNDLKENQEFQDAKEEFLERIHGNPVLFQDFEVNADVYGMETSGRRV